MSRKTHKITAAAIAATLGLTFASADISGAFAQSADDDTAAAQGEMADGQLPHMPGSAAPIFISEEIVQPIGDMGQSDMGQSRTDAGTGKPATLAALVAQMQGDTPLSEQMECLAGAVYFESRGEPLAGQLAVAQVVINRAESSRFPEDYCAVVHQPAQFSFIKKGRMPRIRTGSKAWHRAKAIARIAHEGLWESEAADSLYFHAKYVRPRWSRQKVARATISQHIFYR